MTNKLIVFLAEFFSKLLKGRSHEEILAYAKAKRDRKVFRKTDKKFWKRMDKIHKNDPIGYAYFVNDFKAKYENNLKALEEYLRAYEIKKTAIQ